MLPKLGSARYATGMASWLEECTARLDAVTAELTKWNAAVDAEFGRRFDFNATPAHQFEATIVAAGQAARQHAGPGPRDDAYLIMDELCEHYLSAPDTAPDAERAAIRHVVAARHPIVQLTTWYIGRNLDRLVQTREARWLEFAVAAASIAECAPDYRDIYLSLGDLYVGAVDVGIDPSPVFARVATLSNAEPGSLFGGGSVRDYFAGFEQSAFFASSVRPRLSSPL